MSNQKKKQSSTIAILFGFTSILVLISILILITSYSISSNSTSLNNIVSEQQHIADIYTMRDSAQARALKLYRMMTIDDYFAKDEIFLTFKDEAGKFVQAKNHFLSSIDSATTRKTWNSINPNIIEGSKVQNEAVELIHEEKYAEASEMLLNKVIPIQDKVAGGLFKLLETQNANIQHELKKAQENNDLYYLYIFSLGGMVLLLGLFITYYVYKYNTKTENALIQEQKASERANLAKSTFLANMSHEIRTPLTAIIGFSEQILNTNLNLNDQQKLKQTIVRNSMHLQHLVNDILDLSKIESGELELEMTAASPTQINQEIESIISKRAYDKNLSFKVNNIFPLPSSIISDSVRLKQILLNLCSNAIKFSSEGGITLDTSYNPDTNFISFSVKDTGIGLSEEEQKNIFKPFIQADVSTTRKFGGTGLGLSISHLLATELGGTLVCNSIKDHGSQFILSIPTGITGKIKMITSNEGDVRITDNSLDNIEIKQLQGNILLAEDIKDNQELISLYVTQTGAHIELAKNGEEAIHKALSNTYDLILMDMQMPKVDGVEAISILRKAGYSVPIVSLTANALAAAKEKCLIAGADQFLTKPINVNAFYKTLNKYLKEKDETDIKPKDNVTSGIFKLKQKFIIELPSRISTINAALANKSWEEIDHISHFLKGVSDTFDFPEITEISTLLNKAVRAKEYDDIPELVKKLHQLCDTTVTLIK